MNQSVSLPFHPLCFLKVGLYELQVLSCSITFQIRPSMKSVVSRRKNSPFEGTIEVFTAAGSPVFNSISDLLHLFKPL